MDPSVSVLVLCFVAAAFGAPGNLVAPGHLGVAVVGPSEPGRIIQGPVVHSTLVGPDGTEINSVADSGAVVAAPKSGGVVTADAAIAPGLLPVAPVIAHIAPVAPIVAPIAYGVAPALSYGVNPVISHGLINGHIVAGHGIQAW